MKVPTPSPVRGFWLVVLAVLCVPGLSMAARPVCTATVLIQLEAKAPIAPGLQGKLILRPEGEGEPLTVAAQMGAPVTTELPCASKWEVSPEFPDVWGPRLKLTAGGEGGRLTSTVFLWPLGRIAGSVKLADKKDRLPRKLVAVTLAPRPPARRDTPKGFLDCPIDEKGNWRCPPLPATTFDISLSAEGFIPQYRWEVKVDSGKETRLGIVELKRGASVAGWVEVEDGIIDAGCKARLTPLLGDGNGVQVAEKVRSTAAEMAVRKDGFFQFAGVAPGNYSLEVRQPGFAPATVYPIGVVTRSESFLREPVTLKRPLQVELALSPARDWVGHRWHVQVFRVADAGARPSETAYDGPADEQGLVKVSTRAGRFLVEVTDALDNRILSRRLTVDGPADARQTLDLGLLTVRGRVRYGEDPLAATLWFGGRYGSTSMKMESDRDGKFHGVLPRDGWWSVEIASPEPAFETHTRVRVKKDGEERATVEIDLPATRVFGKVLDDGGRPLPKATFSLSNDQGDIVATADAAGRFDVRGFSEGMAYAGATFSSAQGEWSSDRIALFVREGEDVGPLEVRLRKNARLSGTVRSARGPVPGAGVEVLPLRPNMMFGDSVRTELDGTFTAKVPAWTETADVIVSPPGYALKAFPAAIQGDSPQPLLVEEEGGTLEILLPKSSEDSAKAEPMLWIFQNGLPIPTQILYRWNLGHGKDLAGDPGAGGEAGKRLTVDALAPGEYRACLADRAALVAWEASNWTAPLAKCTAGELSAGTTLRLDLSAP